MKILTLNLLMILSPFLFIAFCVLFNLAANKMTFIYNIGNKDFEFLEDKPWGPGFKNIKKIALYSKNLEIKKKAKESLILWRIGFISFILFCISLISIVILS